MLRSGEKHDGPVKTAHVPVDSGDKVGNVTHSAYSEAWTPKEASSVTL